MDIGNFYKNLDLTSKQLFLSIAVALPFAYIDCWKIYSPFKDLNWLPQLMFSLVIDITFVGLGFALSGVANLDQSEDSHKKLLGYHVLITVISFIASSLSAVIITGWNPISIFLFAYPICLILIAFIFRKIKI